MINPNIRNKIVHILEPEFNKQTQRGLNKFADETNQKFERIKNHWRRPITKALLFAFAFSIGSSSVYGMSKETRNNCNELVNVAHKIQNESNVFFDLQRNLQTNPTTQNSLKLQECKNRLAEYLKEANQLKNDIFDSIRADAVEHILTNNFSQIKEDAALVNLYAKQDGDEKIIEEARKLETELKESIEQGIIVNKIIEEAKQHAKFGRAKEARIEMQKAFNILKKHEFLFKKVIHGYSEVYYILLEDVDTAARFGRYDEAKADAEEYLKAIKSMGVPKEAKEELEQILKQGLSIIVQHILNDAESNAITHNKFDEAYVLILKAKRDFEDIKADSIISITEKKVAESMCKEAMNKSKIHKKFEEGLKLIQTAKERYPDQKEVIQHYSYKFGIVILSEVKDLTIKKHFNQALDMLEYYEKHHFKGPMKSMRKTMANYIMELAKMSSSPREAQNLIKIAKDIEEGRSLGNNLWNWLKVNFS